MSVIRTITPAATAPITVAEAMAFCRVTNPGEASYFTSLIQVARDSIEDYTGRVMINTTFCWIDYIWPEFCHWDHRQIELRRFPLSSVSSVKYYDKLGVLQTLSASDYRINAASRPGYLEFKSQVDLPEVEDDARPDAVQIEFIAGDGVGAVNVNPRMAHALRLVVRNLYDQRSPLVIGTIVNSLPHNLKALLTSLRY